MENLETVAAFLRAEGDACLKAFARGKCRPVAAIKSMNEISGMLAVTACSNCQASRLVFHIGIVGGLELACSRLLTVVASNLLGG